MTRIGPNDDSNGKPFGVEELLARLRAALRRSAPSGEPVLHIGELTIDHDARSVVRNGELIAPAERQSPIVALRGAAIRRALERQGFNVDRVTFARGGHVLVDGKLVRSQLAEAARRDILRYLAREVRVLAVRTRGLPRVRLTPRPIAHGIRGRVAVRVPQSAAPTVADSSSRDRRLARLTLPGPFTAGPIAPAHVRTKGADHD